MREGVVRIDLNEAAQEARRLDGVTDRLSDQREVVQRGGHRVVALEREAVPRLRGDEVVLGVLDLAKVEEGELVRRVLGQSLEVQGDGFVEPARRMRRETLAQRIAADRTTGRGRAEPATGRPSAVRPAPDRGASRSLCCTPLPRPPPCP